MHRPPRTSAEIGLLLFINGIGGLLLLVSSTLREIPEFWRNEGGYPVLLRDLVFFLHYPLLLAVFAGTTVASFMSLRFFFSNRGSGGSLLLLTGLQWLLFFCALTIMLYNNVENLLNGRPLHFHLHP